LNVADLHIGFGKANGYVEFNTGITGGHLALRGTNGGRANVYLGEFTSSGSGTTPTGNLTITNDGCSITAYLNELVVGALNVKAANNTTAGGYGNFVFNAGDVDVNAVILGRNQVSGTATGTCSGVLTMNGGLLNINTNLVLGRSTMTAGGGAAKGYFTLNGGTTVVETVTIADRLNSGTVTGSVTVAGGILKAKLIQAGAGTATRIFDWINGTIQNYDASTDLVISNLNISLNPAGTQALSVDVGRTAYITSVFTDLTQADSSPEMTEIGISSIMDTWILLRNIESQGERNRGLYILKSRGMPHSNQVREFRISEQGIVLADVRVGPEGVLIGSAKVAAEQREKSEAVLRGQELEARRRLFERRKAALEARMKELEAEMAWEAEDLDAARRAAGLRVSEGEAVRREIERSRSLENPTPEENHGR